MTLAADVAPEVLGGRYRLEAPIGYGGMGRVFRARDEVLDRPVAIKLFDTSFAPNALDEARAAGQLSHPGVVQVFDVGTQGSAGYIVMELVDGRSLRAVLRERGRLPPKLAAEIAIHVADALEAAHRAGLVHCDVNPLNVLITREGQTKLIDFGIACRASAAASDAGDEVWGTAAYIAPEQARGGRLDARTDVYALGIVLYEMLVGHPPFRGATAAEMVARRLTTDPLPVRDIVPGVPPQLDRVVMRALARDPRRRYADAGQMRDALRLALASRRGWSPVRVSQLVQLHPRRAVAAAVTAMLVAGLALGGWSFSHKDAERVPTLVGHTPSEAPSLLEQAGIPASELTVLTRPVEADYVGKIVDQQPQPGAPLELSKAVQIAVGVPSDPPPSQVQNATEAPAPPSARASQPPPPAPPGRAKKGR